jgi:uncharacterized protein (DUF2147 family)
MRKIALYILFAILFTVINAYAENPDVIVGEWYNEEGTSVIEIFRCSDSYCGRIAWLKNPKNEEGKDKVDSKNPDESLRSRKLMGLQILSGFSYNGDNQWVDGKIYDPKNGKTYSCKMSLAGDQLNVRGYIGFSLIGRTTVWTRKT